MTEAEWLASKRPDGMLRYSGLVMSQRKCCLVAAACCRRIWSLLEDPRLLAGVEAAELFADGQLRDEELATIIRLVGEAERRASVQTHSAYAVRFALSGTASRAAHHAAASLQPPRAPERTAQACLLREVTGNPFRAVVMIPDWVTPTVLSVAEAAYEERNLASGHITSTRLAVLSDALEDAGCTDANILSHLRSPGPHVRGCWALDLILGKE